MIRLLYPLIIKKKNWKQCLVFLWRFRRHSSMMKTLLLNNLEVPYLLTEGLVLIDKTNAFYCFHVCDYEYLWLCVKQIGFQVWCACISCVGEDGWVESRVCMGVFGMDSGSCYIDLYVQKCEYLGSWWSMLLSVTFSVGTCTWSVGCECIICLCGYMYVVCILHVFVSHMHCKM